ncbi:uncharacterized protein LOC106369824 [Brassica napus]|uniref:uncharacterized protein LOC106369824 n=1 Tax=Brassica napus TaxID=3708 RepID=UPI0006AB186A|nr:uncharacterized protein LOC106369824 [Brassica napus]
MDAAEVKSGDYPPRLYPEGSSNLDVARLAERESMWSGRTVHYLLCRQLRVIKKEIWCLVADEAIRFSLLEFGEFTGLNTGPLPTEKFDPGQYNEFWGELKVPPGMGPKLDELKAALEFCPRWSFEKRKWLGLLLLQAMGVYCLHHNSRIPFQSAIRVFDDEAMRSYPWGRTAYEVLIDSIITLAPDGGSYTISGMKDALLIWAYESVTCFSESFGRVINNEDVPLLRWGGKRTRASFDKLLFSEIEKHGKVRVRRMVLKDSIGEMFPIWPGEDDDPQLVRLITYIHSGRFVKGLWEVQGNAKGKGKGKGNEKKRMKGGVSSEAEPPTKKQKKVKTQNESEADAAGNGSSEKEGSKELELENKATLTTIVNTLDIISRKFDQVDSRLEAYELDRNRPLMDQKTIDDRVNVLLEERLKDLGNGKIPENHDNPSPPLSNPSPPLSKASPVVRTHQKSVNSPVLVDATPGPKYNLAKEL